MQGLDSQRKVAALVSREDVALLQYRSDLCGESALTEPSRFDEQVADPRMDTEVVNRASVGRDEAVLERA